jgi:group I intron endonuclease
MGCVYCATNIINGKKYIGKTNKDKLELRIKEHIQRAYAGSNCIFHLAIVKYGSDNFKWEKQYENHEDEFSLFEMEKELICQLNTKTPNGYNLTNGGEGIAGRTVTDNTKEKMSASRVVGGCGYETKRLRKLAKGHVSGVTYNTKISRWIVLVSTKERRKYVGSYKNYDEALKARKDFIDSI